MDYKIIIQAQISSDDGILGAKEAIAEALELMGCDVQHINVMPNVMPEEEPGEAPKAEPKKYYTAEEVKNMSRAEIRANYNAVLSSALSWK